MCAATDTSSKGDAVPPLVLVVEDDPANLDVISRFLRSSGRRPLGARDAEQALSFLDGVRPDAVLLDIELPGITGFEAIRLVAARCRAPIVLMSGCADEELRRDAMLLGARTLLEKPLDLATLDATLQDLLTDD